MIPRHTAFHRTLLCILALVSGLTERVCYGQRSPDRTTWERLLKSAVQDHVQSLVGKDSLPSSYAHRFVALSGKENWQAIVYLTGPGWCGTGGCTLLILTEESSSYKVISHIPAIRPPIRQLQSRSHGWHDLAVWRAGGGYRGHEERLSFDGESYWWNSSDSAGGRSVEKMGGKIVLSSKDRESPLFP